MHVCIVSVQPAQSDDAVPHGLPALLIVVIQRVLQ
jgi:hypothetical protein